MIERFFGEMRFGLRILARSPAFALIAVTTLALGIGGTTAIFTVADALLLKPLAYEHPERLTLISTFDNGTGYSRGAYSYPRSRFMVERSKAFSGIAPFTPETFNLSDPTQPEELSAARVGWNFFDVLGIRPLLGRGFRPEEDKPGGPPVVLISDNLWARRFASDPKILGRNITLDARQYTIVGVTPPGFQFAYVGANVDIWAPKVFELNIASPQQIARGAGYLNAVARLAPGVSIDQARAEMDVISQQYRTENPGMPDSRLRIAIDDLKDQLVTNVRPTILILFGAVALVLLIACANVAGLLLSRALGRRKEIAVRAALGASRGAIVRQLLAESIPISLLGGLFGVLLSIWGTHVLTPLAGSGLPLSYEIRTDGRVLAFSLSVSLLTSILFGLLPALEISRDRPGVGLREESRGATSSRTKNRLRAALVAGQVALSMVLLVGAGLLIHSFTRLLSVDLGVQPERLLTMKLTLPVAAYPAVPFLGSGAAVNDSRMVNFYRELVGKAAAIPGVRSATLSSSLPVNPSRFSPMLFEGQPPVPLPQRPLVVVQTITPAYLQTMGAPLLHGRAFTARDDADHPRVAIVNQTLAHRFWPHESAVGKHVYLSTLTVEIVGVAGDIRNVTLTAPPSPEIYFPYPQLPTRTMYLTLRAAGDPHGLMSASRRLVASLDSELPVTELKTLDEVLASSRVQARFAMLLLIVFSATALILAIVGLYGAISYSVAQRTQELSIRMALGAERGDIVALVIRQGLALTGIGLLLGVVASLALTRLMASLVFEVSVTDPVSFVASAVVFAAIALLASYIPARRATMVDPASALRIG